MKQEKRYVKLEKRYDATQEMRHNQTIITQHYSVDNRHTKHLCDFTQKYDFLADFLNYMENLRVILLFKFWA